MADAGFRSGADEPAVLVAAIACVAATGPLTVSWKLLLALPPLASVTVTVKALIVWTTVGVPVTAPVEGLKLSPAGRAGETL